MPGKKYDSVASSFRLRSGNTPLFKLMGSSPMQDNPEATHPEHHETEEVDENAYEKMLLASQEAGETLTKQQERILGKYRSRKFKEETQ